MRQPPLGQATPGRMLARGTVRHCPRCGSGDLFESWFRQRPRCPGCGMRFQREEGFWLGGYVINFGIGELSILVLLGVLIWMEANHQRVDVALFVAVGLVLAIVGPAATFPLSRTIWSAIDLIMRPLSPEEVVEAQAAVAAAALSPSGDGLKGRRSRRARAGR
ncbi:MAG TPA: DUF983 domain-containing protein [Acidimicrobiales bacterium]